MTRAEVIVKRGDIEVGERGVVRQAVDVSRLESAIRDGAFGGLGTDVTGVSPGSLRICGLADADNGDLTRDVVELGCVSPLRPVVHNRGGYRRRTRRRQGPP